MNDSLRSHLVRARIAIGVSIGLALMAMLLYPGGTVLDAGTLGYSITLNFLSDLGTTVAFNGESNRAGAVLFVSSLMLLIGAGVVCLVAFMRLVSHHRRARLRSRAAIAAAVIASIAFVGVAMTPENSAMELHVRFTRLAFHVLPLVALFLALAAFADDALPARFALGWGILFVALTAYVALLQWGPAFGTVDALRVYVIAQKAITIALVSGLIVQSVLVERLRPRQMVR